MGGGEGAPGRSPGADVCDVDELVGWLAEPELVGEFDGGELGLADVAEGCILDVADGELS